MDSVFRCLESKWLETFFRKPHKTLPIPLLLPRFWELLEAVLPTLEHDTVFCHVFDAYYKFMNVIVIVQFKLCEPW